MATMEDDEGPQLVHIATLGETPLPTALDGVAVILRLPQDTNPATAKLVDWITLCASEQCALITASLAEDGEDLPPNGVDGFVSFDMAADQALRDDFPDMQILAAGLSSRDQAMQAGERGAIQQAALHALPRGLGAPLLYFHDFYMRDLLFLPNAVVFLHEVLLHQDIYVQFLTLFIY